MKKETNSFKSIFDNLVAQLIWTGIAAFLTGAITFTISRKFEFSLLEIVLMISLSVIIIFAISYVIYRGKNKKLPIYNPVDCDFIMLREERVHKWLNQTDYIHKRRYTLKALRNGLTEYIDKFQWTGNEYVLIGGGSEYTLEEDKNTKNVFNLYHFKFNHSLKKGDIIEVEATWKAKGPAKPFFSTTIEEPTEILVMSVMLYPESEIKEVYCEMESYKGAKCPSENHRVKLNSDGEYVWQVNNPKLLHHYEINWKLNNN